MFTTVDKALVALIMSVLFLANYFLGINWGLSEATVVSIVAVLNPILVWFFANKKA